MSETNRRKFLAVAGAGTAAGVAGLTVGPVLSGSASAATPAVASGKAAREQVVAVVGDHRGSSLTLLVGEREVTVHDRDLVVRLLNAAGGK